MILASYPRSGSTLARLLFRHLLGRQTASVYPEGKTPDFYRQALDVLPDGQRQDQSGVWWKTHRIPDEPITHQSIVIVRNGRTVLQSLHAYYRDVLNQDVSLQGICEGCTRWGCWSAWMRAWRHHAPHAMVVHYEDMLDHPHLVAEQIAERFGLPGPSGNMPDFDALHAGFPAFFRRGDPDPEPWPDDVENAFVRQHQPTMRLYGYD